MIIFIISLSVFLLCIISFIIHKRKKLNVLDTVIGFFTILIFIVSLLFGLIIFSCVLSDHEDIKLIENYEILKGTNTLVLDFCIYGENHIKEFDDHKAYVEIGDSTRFYYVIQRSFYGCNTGHYVIWRNPPYKNLNLE